MPYFIKSLEATNFKSFEKIDVKFDSLNVLVGASGKSNFVTIFKFLKDIAIFGLEDALVMNGGIESIQNMRSSPSNQSEMSISITFWSPKEQRVMSAEATIDGVNRLVSIAPHEITYKIKLNYTKNKNSYHITFEGAEFSSKFSEIKLPDESGDKNKQKHRHPPEIFIGQGKISFYFNETGKLNYEPLINR